VSKVLSPVKAYALVAAKFVVVVSGRVNAIEFQIFQSAALNAFAPKQAQEFHALSPRP
jgi:hypothetical protein